jgi:hypothetical protein
MKKIILFSLIIFAYLFTIAQNEKSNIRKVTLKAKVFDMQNNRLDGYLHAVTDSGIQLKDEKKPMYSPYMGRPLNKIDYPQIQSITFKKDRSIRKGLAYGMLTGLVIGGIVGFASYYKSESSFFELDPTANTIAGMGAGLLIGGGVGFTIGAASKKKFTIAGRQDNYRKMQSSIYSRITPRQQRLQGNISLQ